MIPFENFSQSNSFAYFKYEEKLRQYDPVISSMVSERYHCAIYSDLEDEEDETNLAYESEVEEENSDDNKMEHDSISEMVENSFNQDSDTICLPPTITIKPETEDEEKFQIIESEYFDSKSEIDFLFFKNILLASSVSDLRRHLHMKFGNLSPIVMSSLVTVDFAKPSRFSLFSFDPGGASKNADFCSDFVLDLSHDGLILLSTDLIEKYVDLKFVMPILVFDPGGRRITTLPFEFVHLFSLSSLSMDFAGLASQTKEKVKTKSFLFSLKRNGDIVT